MKVRVIGGGLAGPEAALTLARRGCDVDLYEMRPVTIVSANMAKELWKDPARAIGKQIRETLKAPDHSR